ncbi:pyrroline-5-carboxylate reductase [Thermoactinomyces sp. DSM 45892]|uniref:pyrroline-5-carboxylate reductase n=1 Tax=Thermoactinomyces sp. DSM 45892 TaxID=1882753 RepID=UPI00089642AE|nr:pyrroline-5-carboxylate reductase [Thermoactinomyces sp. DSM 45892]SDZ26604.1 pyrroline-5-carboxylate reductase [Thermoactinomyces sp. DSM 45892]
MSNHIYENLRVGFIGAGSITEAMIAGLTKGRVIPPRNISVVNRSNHNRLKELEELYQLSPHSHDEQAILESDVIVLAIKPNVASQVLQVWGQKFRENQLILSVIAGVSTEQIEMACSQRVAVVRTMPNTSAAVGRSATAICPGRYVKEDHFSISTTILEAIGIVLEVQESQMDAVTGLAGSGPAYFYYMVEAMQKAGVYVGLESDIARQFIIQTCIGAAEMLLHTEKEPSRLREEVTSEGGTTFAGLTTLREFHFEEAICEAITKATERSQELGKPTDYLSSRC